MSHDLSRGLADRLQYLFDEYGPTGTLHAVEQMITDMRAQQTTGRLLGTTDAAVWASEFMRIKHEIETANDGRLTDDEGWMIGWFANAIETGRQAASSVDLLARDGDVDHLEDHKDREQDEDRHNDDDGSGVADVAETAAAWRAANHVATVPDNVSWQSHIHRAITKFGGPAENTDERVRLYDAIKQCLHASAGVT